MHRKDDRRKRASRKRSSRTVWLIIELILLAFFLLVVFQIIQKIHHKDVIAGEEQSARTQALLSQDSSAVADDLNGSMPQMREEIVALTAQNPDAVGLLSFGPDMSLYVCQAEDNSYYASHRFDGSEDPAGMIYMDCRNKLWPRSDNIILYGHNMRTGERFGKLKRFTDKKYLQEYPLFHLTDLYFQHDYIPFAILYTTVNQADSEYFDFAQVNFKDETAYIQYVETAKQKSIMNIPVDVRYGDALLTLETCSEQYDNGRLVIICRAVKDGEKFD